MRIVETVPNISEGRRPSVIARCATAARRGGASLLDVHSDSSHHRSVLTCAGDPAEVTVGILSLVEQALRDIDLRRHQGVHPRLGAVDVVPLVPLAEVSMADCVAMAREIGAAIARRFELPVYLYANAASGPHRERLDAIRRGGFEGLAERMSQAGWAPDFGPASPHPTAGATVIGARNPLIAYNINLETDDLAVARAIAAVIRERSGGLPCVKALGVPLPDLGIVQVTTNLTDYRVTSMSDVFDRVSAEAALHGVSVRESEIVGLVPAAALPPGPGYRLKLRSFSEHLVLERRLEAEGRHGPWMV